MFEPCAVSVVLTSTPALDLSPLPNIHPPLTHAPHSTAASNLPAVTSFTPPAPPSYTFVGEPRRDIISTTYSCSDGRFPSTMLELCSDSVVLISTHAPDLFPPIPPHLFHLSHRLHPLPHRPQRLIPPHLYHLSLLSHPLPPAPIPRLVSTDSGDCESDDGYMYM